ncbi:hypothetical protein Aduo_014910 [Ancylostoma duodenale]
MDCPNHFRFKLHRTSPEFSTEEVADSQGVELSKTRLLEGSSRAEHLTPADCTCGTFVCCSTPSLPYRPRRAPMETEQRLSSPAAVSISCILPIMGSTPPRRRLLAKNTL